MRKLALSEVLEGIEDTRRTRSVMYPLHEVLIIMYSCKCVTAAEIMKHKRNHWSVENKLH